MPGAAIDAKLGWTALDDLGAKSVTKSLEGHVTFDDLSHGFMEVVRDLEQADDLTEYPILVALVSCHAVQIGHRIFPHLIPSDARVGEESLHTAFDFEEHFVKPLYNLRFRSKRVKKLRAILVLDCCRSMVSDSEDTERGPPPNYCNFLTSLKHDFYLIFSTDPGRKSWDGQWRSTHEGSVAYLEVRKVHSRHLGQCELSVKVSTVPRSFSSGTNSNSGLGAGKPTWLGR